MVKKRNCFFIKPVPQGYSSRFFLGQAWQKLKISISIVLLDNEKSKKSSLSQNENETS